MAKRRKNDEYVHPSLKGLPDEPAKMRTELSQAGDKTDITPGKKTRKAAEAVVAKEMSRPGELKMTVYLGPVTVAIEVRVP